MPVTTPSAPSALRRRAAVPASHGPRRPGRPGPRRGVPRWAVATIAAVIVLAVIGAGVALGIHTAQLSAGSVLTVILQEDRQSGAASAGTRALIASAADAMSAKGGGTLVLHEGAGETPTTVAKVDLAVDRDGGPESDADLRAKAIRARVDRAFGKAAAEEPTGEGRSLAELLSVAADDAAPGARDHEVWLRSLALPTTDPTDVRVLMAADPAAAVASLPRSGVPDLRGMRLHVVFAQPQADQPPLNLATAQWRRAFLAAYIKRAGGVLVSATEEQGTRAAPTAPSAPVVPNLPDPTPQQPTAHADGSITASIDTSSLFLPDEAVLISPDEARAQLQPLVDAWRTGRFSQIVCRGRIAAYGDPGSPLGQQLSLDRARRITEILASEKVPATPVGLGATAPLPGFGPKDAAQRSVVCTAESTTDH
ncbi:hypothetical protein GCM10009840_32680 [Pseudolysinimonas kribbensis]|uniref:OmpA-like domain-containing protein n=1 Tax=Pseudolysinimonas kribbensis TaxID=433641 RepID=A0ABQ6JYH0_9MICO|nr:hypothetical protein [Pseudolysinimonas kribbensis]GMA93373.1 hypothetical protein GCM10025881_01970 [Pseudolysinimonas kribbensis]